MEAEYYFEPVKTSLIKSVQRDGKTGRLGNSVDFCKKGRKISFTDIDVAIIGVEGCVNSPGNKGCEKAPDAVRSKLYELRSFDRDIRIADLGNIKGKTANDKLIALSEACSYLLENLVIPLIIGGSQDYTMAFANALSGHKEAWTLSVIDSTIDHSGDTADLTSSSFLTRLFEEHKEKVEGINMIAVQKYLYSPDQEKLIIENNFDLLRLGEIKGESIRNVEPRLRDSDILSIDVSSVKKADMPAQAGAMPNGLFSHEICQLAWYAGISDRLKLFGLFELNPEEDDEHGNGVALSAQVLWHFIEGITLRFNDYPMRDIETYSIYIVHNEDVDMDIRFFNNPQNDRWWVEVPDKNSKVIMSCSKEDYDNALKNELPEKWIFFTKKSSSESGNKDDFSTDID